MTKSGGEDGETVVSPLPVSAANASGRGVGGEGTTRKQHKVKSSLFPQKLRHHRHGGIVIRLTGNFRNILYILDGPVRADDEDSAGEKTLEGTFGDERTIRFAEAGITVIGSCLQFVYSL